MKKFFAITIIFLIILGLIPTTVYAGINFNAIRSPLPDDIFTIIGNLTTLIQPGVIITFLGVSIYGGYLRMTAAGDADQEAKSMKVLTGGIIGFAVVVLAPVIVNFVGQLLKI